MSWNSTILGSNSDLGQINVIPRHLAVYVYRRTDKVNHWDNRTSNKSNKIGGTGNHKSFL